MGETTTRLRAVTPLSAIGVNSSGSCGWEDTTKESVQNQQSRILDQFVGPSLVKSAAIGAFFSTTESGMGMRHSRYWLAVVALAAAMCDCALAQNYPNRP